MSRTAKPVACPRKKFSSVVLLIIVFCLSAHFLVEDMLINCSMEPSSQGCSPAGLAFEMQHQDDLVRAADLPVFTTHNDPPAISVWSIHLERQHVFPIHIPPKIA